jgi:hypothetical protein
MGWGGGEGVSSIFKHAIAKFLVPDWGDIVDSGIELSYRPARLHRMAGRYDNPTPQSTISPVRGLKIWPLLRLCHFSYREMKKIDNTLSTSSTFSIYRTYYPSIILLFLLNYIDFHQCGCRLYKKIIQFLTPVILFMHMYSTCSVFLDKFMP